MERFSIFIFLAPTGALGRKMSVRLSNLSRALFLQLQGSLKLTRDQDYVEDDAQSSMSEFSLLLAINFDMPKRSSMPKFYLLLTPRARCIFPGD